MTTHEHRPNNQTPRVPPLNIQSGTITFSAQDLVNLEKRTSPVPKKFIKCLVKKWDTFFRLMRNNHKNTREFVAPLGSLPFKNKFGVSWLPPTIALDVVQQTFRLSSRPSSQQDQLCFLPAYDPGFNVSLTNNKLKTLFVNFFETVNQARWCSNCGEFSWNCAYNSEMEMCDHCLVEEICAFSKSDSQHCTICLEDGKRLYKTRCGHYFHRACLAKTESDGFGPRCPLCRAYLDIYDERISDTGTLASLASPDPSHDDGDVDEL